jgi:DGQHR domain-containing protein
LGFSSLQFSPDKKSTAGDAVSFGSLSLPVLQKDAEVTGWVVDGQQRALALTQADNPNLAVPVSAFEAATLDQQRDQFLRINNVRPLPRALITELLPTLPGNPPRRYKSRALPSRLCERLNTDSDSPFYRLIKRPSTPKDERRKRVVTDTSLIDGIEKSLKSPTGAFFPYQNLATGEAEIEPLYKMLRGYWKGVKQVFPDAWGHPPRRSRLMHGVGIKALGRLMDHVLRSIPSESEIETVVASEIKKIEAVCAWTEGTWRYLGNIPWNALQNTPRHVRLLSDHLISTYRGH